jgi:drug/metabolite transporter (DMT)-like permease
LHIMAGASVTVAIAAAVSGDVVAPVGAFGWAALTATAIFYAAAIITVFIAMSMAGPVRTTLVMYAEPVGAVIFGWSLLGQALSTTQVIGVAMVVVALLAVRATGRNE